jgi:hypothetical protein
MQCVLNLLPGIHILDSEHGLIVGLSNVLTLCESDERTLLPKNLVYSTVPVDPFSVEKKFAHEIVRFRYSIGTR